MEQDVVPGRKLGNFELGMILGDALEYIQKFPVDFSRVCLKYHPMRPFGTDITLDLDHRGFLLRFDPTQQRLKQIEIYNVQSIGQLVYKGHIFCRPHELATCHRICERFGPSVPGEYSPTKKVYKLHYPGISFYFPIPDEYAKYCPGPDDHSHFVPLEFPGGLSPVTSRIIIYCGGDPRSDSFFLPPLPRDSLYFEEVKVVIGTGIHFTQRQKSITFQTSVQEVLSSLGRPEKVFYKDADSIQLHIGPDPTSVCHSASASSDYFFNFFSLGIDLLFDQHSHFVKKIILHANFPCHFDFNRYRKCNYQIVGLQPLRPSSHPSPTITSDTHWPDVSVFFPLAGRPVVDNRGSNDNPFGSRRFYGFKDIIFEVMRNDYVASIILFSS